MDNNINFDILELAVMYTALKERLERLQKLFTDENDIKLKGEIELINLSIKKVNNLYVSKTGSSKLLN